MLYVFSGTDTAKAKVEARKLAKGCEVIAFGEGGESFDRVMSYVGSRGLFAPEIALLIDRPLENTEGKALIEEHAEALHKADIKTFVITGPLSATDKKLFPRGAEFKEFEPKGKQEYVRPNVFGFTDAFLAGDRKKTWIGYRKLISEGVAPEEIHGALMWAIRSALISAKTKSATEAGLKPFVYSKSKRAAEKLGIEKVEQYSRELVAAYHQARSGVGELGLNLELVLLEK